MTTGLLAEHKSKHMPTAADIIHHFVECYSAPEAPAEFRKSACELAFILSLDPTAVKDLIDAISPGRQSAMLTWAEGEQFMNALMIRGIIRHRYYAGEGKNLRRDFHADLLIALLKSMPHRDPSLGIARDRLTSCTIE